jgi:outer membrane usher protein
MTQPYIMSSTVLRKGVTDYTYEAGSLRYGYGLSHSGYTSFFASGTQRYGWSDSLTLSARAELQGNGQTVGVGADRAFLHLGALGAGVALSHGPQGGGGLVYGQFVHASERFDFSAMATIDNSTFRQLGLLANERAPRITAQATADRKLGKQYPWLLATCAARVVPTSTCQTIQRWSTSAQSTRLSVGSWASI